MIRKERMMERPQLTPERAEMLITLLRDNPGVSMTLSTIADETGLPVEDIAAYFEELASQQVIVKETTVDGFDTYRFAVETQTGTTGPLAG
jgi:hypothetical protein